MMIDEPIDILLIEDNPGDVRLVEEALKSTESQTSLHTISTGTAAIELLRQENGDGLPFVPDIALVDLNLPGKDGCDVLEAIRDDSQLKHLPVIILTSSKEREDVKQCYNATANAYLTKPDSPEGYVSLIEAVEQFWFKNAHLPPISQ